jgi:hypothetical protein
MKRYIGVACLTLTVFGIGYPAGAGGDKSAQGILDKAIKALGGEDKLGKAQAFSYKAKGTISFGDNENPFTSQTIVQDLDHNRREFEAEFGGNKFKAVTVINGDKGWRHFGDNTMELDKDGIASEKRNAYLSIIAFSILPLKGKDFKVEALPDAKGDAKSALVKVVGPDGKDCTLYFNKDSGLLTKQLATVKGFDGMEFMQETTYAAYKDFDGIKRATKIELNRDGNKFMAQEITEFKLLGKVDPKMFAQPE